MGKLGRIILFIVSGCLIGISLPVIINNIQIMNQSGWTDLSTYKEKFQLFFSMGGEIFACLCGVIGVIASLVGRKSFILILLALIQLGIAIAYVVIANNNGTNWSDWTILMPTIAGFILPGGYFLGAMLMKS